MKAVPFISRTHAEDATPSLSLYHVIADWDWRIARLLSALVFFGASLVQIEWAHDSNVRAISFYYSIGAAACAVCSMVYWYLVRYEPDQWSIEQHKQRFHFQFVGCIVWIWTASVDIYAHLNDIIVMDGTSWQHHLIINGIVISFLVCECANEMVAVSRAMAYHEEGE